MIKNECSKLLKALLLIAGISFHGISQNLHTDTLLVQKLGSLSNQSIEKGEIEKAIGYSEKALKISRKCGYENGIARAYFTLGNAYTYNSRNTIGLEMYRKALKIYIRNKNYNSVADCYLNIGATYDDMSDYGNALDYYYRSLEVARKMNRTDLFGDCYRNIGIVEYSIGNYPKSLKSLYRALQYYEQQKARLSIADVYNCLGNVYSEEGDKTTSLNMYFTSLKIARELDEKESIGNAYVNIGSTYDDMGKYDKAVGMCRLAIQTYKEISNPGGLSLAYNSIADAYYHQGNYEESLRMSDEALKLAKVSLDQTETVVSYINIGNVYIRQNKLDAARRILNRSLELSKQIGSKLFTKETYESLIELEKKSGNYQAAFENQHMWMLYKDSINNEETVRQSYRTVLEYSFEKKALAEKEKNDKAVAKLQTQNKLSKERQLSLTIILIVLLLSAIVVWFFARKAYNNRKKLAEVLANENQHKEALLQEVHHRVNNSLQMISSLLSIQADTTESEEIREYLIKSENRVQAMSVMHQLLHLGNSKLEVNMSDYFSEVLQFYRQMLESRRGIVLNSNIPSILFHTKLAMPLALILNELITNSLKYAFPDNVGEIEVLLEKQTNGEWLFRVKDNGIGFKHDESKLESSSIGLSLVQLMTKQIDGKLKIDSTSGMLVEIVFMSRHS